MTDSIFAEHLPTICPDCGILLAQQVSKRRDMNAGGQPKTQINNQP